MMSFSNERSALRILWFVLSTIGLGMVGPVSASERAALEAALSEQPDNLDIKFRVAQAMAWDGDYDEARAIAEEIVAAIPEHWDAHLLLARLSAWEKDYDDALERIELVLKHQPTYRDAIMLKLDVLTWKEDRDAASALIDQIMTAGNVTADLHYRKAQIHRQHLRYWTAYRHAKAALAIDPLHAPSKELIENTRRATVFFSNELEYYNFRNADPGQKWGYGFSAAAQVLPRNRISVTILDTFRYRFQSVNNQVGAEAVYRATERIDLTLRGLAGAPAVVVPRGTLFVSIRGEIQKRLDATLSYQLDVLSWPVNRPGLLQRPALDVGVFVHKTTRLTAGYTLGMFHHCGESVNISHGARGGFQFDNGTLKLGLAYGFGEEYDKNDALSDAPASCAVLNDPLWAGRQLIGIKSHTVGFSGGRQLSKTFSLSAGYALTLLMPSTADIVTNTHMVSLGGIVWF